MLQKFVDNKRLSIRSSYIHHKNRNKPEFGHKSVSCHFAAQRRNPYDTTPEKVSGWDNLKQQRSFLPANASYLAMSEGFLRLRLRNDSWDFNYRTQQTNPPCMNKILYAMSSITVTLSAATCRETKF